MIEKIIASALFQLIMKLFQYLVRMSKKTFPKKQKEKLKDDKNTTDLDNHFNDK